MNKNQKIVMVLALVVFGIILLFPPTQDYHGLSTGWSEFILNISTDSIDLKALLVRLMFPIVIGAAGVILLSIKKR